MKQIRIALFIALVLAVASFGVAAAQSAYGSTFTTSITFQNVGTDDTTVNFQFYNQGSSTPTTVNRPLAAGAGSSLWVGGLQGNEALPAGFLGAAVAGSTQPIVATMVQIPNNANIKVRPLSNGFSSATAKVLLATVLKNQFGSTSKFSIQNADSSPVDITVNLVSTSGQQIPVVATSIPVGSAKYFDMGVLSEVSAGSFNGSATVNAVKTGTQNAANIVGSVMELSTGGKQATAFEGVSQGAPTLYVATALCKLSLGGGLLASTAYAIQNVGTNPTDVTVTFVKPGQADQPLVKTIPAGGKASFGACEVNSSGFSGSAKVTSSGEPLVAIAKAFGDSTGALLSTAFLGEAAGSTKLALPYVRFTGDPRFLNGTRQRAYISVQNVSASPVDIVIEYRDSLGVLIGSQSFTQVGANEKRSSNALIATPAAGIDNSLLQEFGYIQSNGTTVIGGSAVVRATGNVIAVDRVVSFDTAANQQVGEDFNGIAIQ